MTLTGDIPPMPKVPPPKQGGNGTKYGILNVTKGFWLWDFWGNIFVFTDPRIAKAQAGALKVLSQTAGCDTDDELVVKAFVMEAPSTPPPPPPPPKRILSEDVYLKRKAKPPGPEQNNG